MSMIIVNYMYIWITTTFMQYFVYLLIFCSTLCECLRDENANIKRMKTELKEHS